MTLRGDGAPHALFLTLYGFTPQSDGHSMRAGYATAAAADMPSYCIQQHTRHRSADMVDIREADKWTRSGLRGLGF
jgi:hypothetical protein